MRQLFIFAFALSIGFASVPAQAGLLEFFFPSLKQDVGPDPSVTLQAPFAQDDIKTEEELEEARKESDLIKQGADLLSGEGLDGKPIMPENAIPLEQPHRSSSAISEWIMTASAESLMFDDEDYKKDLAESQKYFSPSGRSQYRQFLDAQGIQKTLTDGRYDIRSFVNETPILLNEGVVDGRYRWLYDVNMMLTYLNRGTKEYSKVVPINKQLKVRLQIGRSPDAKNRDEIWVETWSGKFQEAKKK